MPLLHHGKCGVNCLDGEKVYVLCDSRGLHGTHSRPIGYSIAFQAVPSAAYTAKHTGCPSTWKLVEFRPHFMLYYHSAPYRAYMQKLVERMWPDWTEQVDYSGYQPGGR